MTNLFMPPRALGDTILVTGIIDLYKTEHSAIVASACVAPLFEDFPNLERLTVVDKEPWKKHWLKSWRVTRGVVWDLLISARGTLLSRLLRARKKQIWPRTQSPIHKVDQISAWFGYQKPIWPTIWVSQERHERMRPSRPTLAVAPIAGWIGKQWPLENFITLLQMFCETYPEAQVAIFAALHERDRILPLLDALPQDQCVDTIGQHLLDTAALIKWSQVFIGNDSGLMHMSLAVKTPTIALFGPSDERIFGPWSDQVPSPHRVVRGAPFTGHVPQNPLDTKCYMNAIIVPLVWETLQERWENVGDPQQRVACK